MKNKLQYLQSYFHSNPNKNPQQNQYRQFYRHLKPALIPAYMSPYAESQATGITRLCTARSFVLRSLSPCNNNTSCIPNTCWNRINFVRVNKRAHPPPRVWLLQRRGSALATGTSIKFIYPATTDCHTNGIARGIPS